jgi:hypothetical protein
MARVDVEHGLEAAQVRLGEELREVDGVQREQGREAVGHSSSLPGLRDNDIQNKPLGACCRGRGASVAARIEHVKKVSYIDLGANRTNKY